MKISVVVPTRLRDEFLQEALGSIAGQRPGPEEVIVVDDGASAATERCVHRWGARYVSSHGVGPAAARNLGVAEARGEVLAFLDSDDLWRAGHLERLLPHLKANQLVRGQVQRQRQQPDGRFLPEAAPYFFVNLGAMLMLRACWQELGGLNEALRENEDTDWYLRCWEQGLKLAQVSQVSLDYRLHQSNLVHEQRLGPDQGMARLLLLRRRRQRAGLAPAQSLSDWAWDQYRGSCPD